MIPCKNTCLDYYEGCHKTCPVWQSQQARRTEEYKRKMAYLKEHNEICSIMLNQLQRLTYHRIYY